MMQVNGEKWLLFIKNFSTNQYSRKNESQLVHFSLIGIERPVNTDAEKFPFTFVVISKSVRKNFFILKIFQPIRIREKIKFNYSIFSPLEWRDQWTLVLKKFHWPLLYSPNAREKFFFFKIFLPIRFREKIKFNSSTFSPLESRDQWTLILKKFYWPLLYSPNRGEKNFFLKNFSTNQISRKNQIQFFVFFLIGIERPVNTDTEKILLTFIGCL